VVQARVKALVLRHAQSTWNATSRWQGQADPPLSEAGREQVRRSVPALLALGPFGLVVSSSLARASTTAHIFRERAGWDAPHFEEPLLNEYDVGEWSGLDREEIAARWPRALERFDAGLLSTPPGGEARASFDRRVALGIGRIEDLAVREGADRVLVVVHGGVIRSMMRSGGHPESHVRHLCGYLVEIAGGAVRNPVWVDLLRAVDPAPGGPDL
jgi:broad specificity phosphatase PhoE